LAAADPKNQRFRLAVASALTRVGLVELKAGDPAAARDHYRQALSLYEAISRGDPANEEAREDVAAGLSAEAGAGAALAAAPKTVAAEKTEHWRQARSLYRASLDVWLDLKKRSVLRAANAGELEEVSKQIAACDRALAGR